MTARQVCHPACAAASRTSAPALAFCLLLAPACGGSGTVQPPPNVLVVTVDTLRADRLSFYGHPHETAPFLASFAARSTVFENAWSTSSWTAPATASLFTSLYPFQHGVLTGYEAWAGSRPTRSLNRIPEAAESLPQVLAEAGWRTFGLADNPNIGPAEGFERGFERFHGAAYEGAEALHAVLEGWAEELRAEEPWFLYLHYMDPHKPYHRREPWFRGAADPEPWGERVARLGGREALPEGVGELIDSLAFTLACYDSEIGYLDGFLERAFALAGAEEAVVLLTSDHGEEFGDHGDVDHGFRLYQELCRVPFLLRSPDHPASHGARVTTPVSLVDVLPTLRELLGLPPSARDAGASLVPLLNRGSLPPRALFASRTWERPDALRELVAVLEDGSRAIHASPEGTSELYDLGTDPREQADLGAGRPAQVERLLESWRRFRSEAFRHEREFGEDVTVDPEMESLLKELGYFDEG